MINANALHIPLKDKTVQCCVTSPPYWGLRDYGTAEWMGGDPDCDHQQNVRFSDKSGIRDTAKETVIAENKGKGTFYKDTCKKCGAIRIDKQLGLEQTPEEYVENMVAVFREVWRVLRDDGTLWLNLGDSYNGKQLIGIPWRVAFALQADGWYLRNDIIWHKPNPMPESVRDRCTKSHEYIFLLTKSAKYYYDNEAIKEPAEQGSLERMRRGVSDHHKNVDGAPGQTPHSINQPRLNVKRGGFNGKTNAMSGREAFRKFVGKRNRRTVWTITTKPYSGAHYATFPPEIPETCINAGTSEAGKCPDCGMPFERVKEVVSKPDRDTQEARENMVGVIPGRDGVHRMNSKDMESIVYKDVGWQAQCECGKDPIPCIVLDPFIGSGTTCMVARDLGRDSVGLDLSLDYLVNNAKVRLQLDKLEYWYDRGPEVKGNFEGLPMFTD